MEIKGEEFIKKVQLQQEKNEIEQRLNEIKNQESVYQEPVQQQRRTMPPNLDKEIEIQEEQEYSDIMLNNSNTNAVNKKKYLILGLVLVILFLLTIIIIRLLTNDDSSNNSFSENKEQNAQQVLDSENIEEQYQKIINEKLKNIKEENEKVTAQPEEVVVNEKLDLQKIEEKEKVIKKEKPTKQDVFDVKKNEQYKPVKKVAQKEPKPKIKPPVKKVTPKAVKKTVQKTASSITSKPKGTFVQVGAFSKMPSDKYLQGITKKGFKYKIYKVSINNKLFHKVLIGPYNSRGQAKLAIDGIKKKLNISGAFILTF